MAGYPGRRSTPFFPHQDQASRFLRRDWGHPSPPLSQPMRYQHKVPSLFRTSVERLHYHNTFVSSFFDYSPFVNFLGVDIVLLSLPTTIQCALCHVECDRLVFSWMIPFFQIELHFLALFFPLWRSNAPVCPIVYNPRLRAFPRRMGCNLLPSFFLPFVPR